VTTLDPVKAVVIGASMAGLAAARVLSDRFDSVTVLDRDVLPGDNTPRRGVPQGAHGHILLVSGLRELSALFPGLEDDLVAAGGTRFDPGLELCTYRFGQRWPRSVTGLELVAMSRPQLELTVREHVTKLAGVTIRDQIAVTGLTSADGTITGVELDTGETLDADLVVDCSGRGSRSDRWLGDLGFPAPEQVEIKVGVAYATRIYRRTGTAPEGWTAIFTLPTPPQETMAALVVPLEGDRWLAGIAGWHVTDPPGEVAAFEAAARALPDPATAELISREEPLTDPVVHRFPSSRRRLFEQLDRLPSGYVALGDAICSFNPIYGQGMTCAIKEAVALGAALERHGRPDAAMAADYYGAAAEVITTPWQFAVGGDFNYPQTTGPRPQGVAFRNWFARRIALASQIDAGVNATFHSVQQLVAPPSVLFTPGFIARVLWLNRPGARARSLSPAP
jgi:2-polyprenyl-6-methoxyphenol hydroxylase-like FAD-dependent oxidoreductase